LHRADHLIAQHTFAAEPGHPQIYVSWVVANERDDGTFAGLLGWGGAKEAPA
jgi:hypothetical protein